MNITQILINTTTATQSVDCGEGFVSSTKVMITFGMLVIIQSVRGWMHYKNIRKYEKGMMSKDNFINNQYLMGILDISSYPLIIFLLFVFLRFFV